MNKKNKNKILFWIPSFLWMIFIFLLSHRQTTGISGTQTQRFLFFKSLHLIEYTILFFLCLFSFAKTIKNKNPLFLSFLLSWFYAFSDEFHQSLVPGRNARLSDTFIDLTGICIGILIYFLIISKRGQKISFFKKIYRKFLS